MVGSVGKEGIWVLGMGGNVGCGIVGTVGRVGTVGIAGSGGNVGLGRDGIVGTAGSGAAGVCKRWRAAMPISVVDRDNATIKDKMKQCLEVAIV
ncbi:hypothetical protein L1049_025154 [Liquidambar formosana]|uniref:Uncharacterized protein n=1 Tax=Liquidambar formosana TaxID=63359 RepID=A0AAP0X0B1_LIQFO